MDASPAPDTGTFHLGSHAFRSRLLTGTGKYPSLEVARAALRASGCEVVTVAVRRVPLDGKGEGSLLEALREDGYTILPNTAGCYSAEEAVRTARLAREALGTTLLKLEVIGDPKTLFPDNEQTLAAATTLCREGFEVLPYVSDDLIVAKKLRDVGCAAVMPLAAPIGSGLGICDPYKLEILIRELEDVPIVVDAGVGTASDAAVAMELGATAILMNTAIAEAQDPVRMAHAMRLAVTAGRLAQGAGRMPKKLYASASSPIDGVIGSQR